MQRLGKNLGGYHGERIEIRSILRDLESAALATGWKIESFFARDGFHWLALQRPALHQSPAPKCFYLSTGIHGDEPAGPLAALRLLRENTWPADAELFFCPCLNPTGFALGRRESDQAVDLNRDYLNPISAEITAHINWLERQPRFDLCLCLHEDWESHGFYGYELNPERKPSLAEPIVAAAQRVCPIDHSEMIEGRAAKNGIIRPDLDPRTRPKWAEAFWLITHKTRLSYTLEAPSDFPLATRVDALVAGVNAALGQ